MVALGEDWKSVEVPVVGGEVKSPSSEAKEIEESIEQPSGGNSNVIYIYIFQSSLLYQI